MKTGKPSRRTTIQLWQTQPIPVQLHECTPATAPPPPRDPAPPRRPRRVPPPSRRRERRGSCARRLGCLLVSFPLLIAGMAAAYYVAIHLLTPPDRPPGTGVLAVSPAYIDAHSCVGGSGNAVSLTLMNTGDADLTWERSVQKGASSDVSQRIVSPQSGIMAPGDTEQVTVSGTYYGTGAVNTAFDTIVLAWSSGARSETVTIREECVGRPAPPSPR